MPLRRSSWTVIVVAVVAAAAWVIVPMGFLRRAEPPVPPDAATNAQPSPDATTNDPPSPDADRECEIAGVVRRGGAGVASRIEVRLVRTTAEETNREFSPWAVTEDAMERRIERLRRAPIATVRTSEDGRFLVRGLAPAGYVVRATALDDGSVGKATVSLVVEGQSMGVTLEARAARERLRGRVVYADGRPVAGDVLVFHAAEGDGATGPDTGESASLDGEGRFDVAGLHPGKTSVCAVGRDGSQATDEMEAVPSNEGYVLTVEADRSVTEGRIQSTADGTPIAGAEVVGASRWTTEFGPRARVRTDAAGRYRVLVPSRGGRIAVRAGGFVETEVRFEEAMPHLDVRLARGARVHGRARARIDGRAMAGVHVFIVANPLAWDDDVPPRLDRVTVTDAAGDYEFEGLAARAYGVFARGADLVSAEFLDTSAADRVLVATLRPGEDRALDLDLVRGARIVGSLVDASGVPVRGALVRAIPRWRPMPGRIDRDEFSVSFRTFGGGVASSRGDGFFSIGALAPGLEYEVSSEARAADETGAPKQSVIPDPGVATRVDLRRPSPRWVDVTVADAQTGAPIEGASAVVVTIADPKDGIDEKAFARLFGRLRETDRAWSLTDVAGRARVGPLGAGRLVALATANGFAYRQHGWHVDVLEDAAGGLSATVRLERGRTISGQVRRPDGTPAAGADLTLREPNAASLAYPWRARTDEHGAFTFGNLGEGDHELRGVLHHGGLLTGETSVLAGTADVVLTLARGPGPHGLVARAVDSEGSPVSFALARFESPSGQHFARFVDGRAEFDFSASKLGVPTVGTVVIRQARDREGVPLPLGSGRLDGVHPGDEVVVTLPRERRIEGRVVGPDGRGIEGVRVRAEPLESSSSSPPAYKKPISLDLAPSVRTDANGTYRLGQLDEGPVWIVTEPPVGFVPPPPVEALAGEPNVKIRVDAAIAVALTVIDADGRPVPGARVAVAKPGGSSTFIDVLELLSEHGRGGVESVAGPDGVARPTRLDARVRYVIGVRGPASRLDLAEYLDTAWSPKDTTIRLGVGLTVSGVVRDGDGKPITGAQVICARESKLNTAVTTGIDGEFRFGGLPPGTVEIRANVYPPDFGRTTPVRRAKQSVPVGTQGVVLVVK